MNEILGFIIALVIFSILMFFLFLYLTFKIIQFIVVAINLYKEMIQNQKRMIALLKQNIVYDDNSVENRNIICSKCQHPNDPESKFCENCGTLLRKPDTKSSAKIENSKLDEDNIYCIECGTEIPDDKSTCPKCGWSYE